MRESVARQAPQTGVTNIPVTRAVVSGRCDVLGAYLTVPSAWGQHTGQRKRTEICKIKKKSD